MASTGLDFSNITPDNGAVRELAELLFLQYFQEPNALDKFCTFAPGVHTGDKMAGLGRFGPMGKRITGLCNPSYESHNINTQEKEWTLGAWAIFEEICIDDIKATLLKHTLKSGTAIADMTGSDYIDSILMPLLEDAIMRTLWRLSWFGDVSASNATISEDGTVSGGTLSVGLDPAYFTVCDGFFKRLITLATARPEQRVTIAANAEKTLAGQKAKLRESGVVTKLMDDTIDAMPMVLRQQQDKFLLVTQSIADALDIDIRNNNKGSELQWESIFAGITMTTYRGCTVYAVALMDEMLYDFFRIKGNDVDYVVNPHRIVATTPGNLQIGSSSTEMIATLEAWFNQDLNVNRIKANDTIGTQIWQDDLCVVAY